MKLAWSVLDQVLDLPLTAFVCSMWLTSGCMFSCSVMSNSVRPRGLEPTRLLCPWDSPGKNTGVGCHFLLQGIFPTQGSNPGLPHCRWILYQLSHEGSPRILEWVAYLFSRGSFRSRNWAGVSCIAGGFFTSWAIREVLDIRRKQLYVTKSCRGIHSIRQNWRQGMQGPESRTDGWKSSRKQEGPRSLL